MKRIILATLAILFATPAFAEQKSFAWDMANPAGITGYKLYCATAKPYTASVATIPAATKTATVDLPGALVPTNYTCVCRSYVNQPTGNPKESEDSNEIAVPIAAGTPPSPTNLRLTLTFTTNPDGTVTVLVTTEPVTQVIVAGSN